MAATLEVARRYRGDLDRLSSQTLRLLLRLWRQVDARDISGSWSTLLPDAAAVVGGAQLVAAEMADPYLTALGGPAVSQRVAAESFVGELPGGGDVANLLYMPAIAAKQAIAAGRPVEQAIESAGQQMLLYAKTALADTGRLATTASMTAHHSTGYYRALQLPSCDRCAILAGRWYRYNAGFLRHPKCDCYHVPVWEADDSLIFDARKAIESGQVHGLSHEESYAITQLGANPAQVVNAKRGLYTAANGRRFTREATTRQGIAGARMLARDVDRSLGRDTTGTYRNWTFTRREALEANAALFRRGKTFTRTTKSGRTQTYAYRFARSMRPTPEQILADATSRDDAIRLLTNYGYIL